jgi:hypothetical protein
MTSLQEIIVFFTRKLSFLHSSTLPCQNQWFLVSHGNVDEPFKKIVPLD